MPLCFTTHGSGPAFCLPRPGPDGPIDPRPDGEYGEHSRDQSGIEDAAQRLDIGDLEKAAERSGHKTGPSPVYSTKRYTGTLW
jgi:hypothetical protein